MFKCFKHLEHDAFASAQHAATVFNRTIAAGSVRGFGRHHHRHKVVITRTGNTSGASDHRWLRLAFECRPYRLRRRRQRSNNTPYGAAEAEFARLFGRSLSATSFARRQSPRLKVARAKPPRSAVLRDEGVLALV
jgi:hypothetical protein